MAYSLNHTWSSGETITTERMQSLEDGVYDNHYANAGAHNALYRGKQIGTSIDSTVAGYISAGTFNDLFVGDYWTISSKVYRIAGFDYYYNCGSTNLTTHHAAVVPDANMYSVPMNSSNTTDGAYVGSAMYTCEEITVSDVTYTGLANAISTIEAAFGDYVLTYSAYLANAVSSGRPSAAAWCTNRVCDLMTENMVYGGPVLEQMSYGGTAVTNQRVEKSQLPLFAMNPTLINIRAGYWLRDVVSSTTFANVYNNGPASNNDASNVYGVRPCFLVK